MKISNVLILQAGLAVYALTVSAGAGFAPGDGGTAAQSPLESRLNLDGPLNLAAAFSIGPEAGGAPRLAKSGVGAEASLPASAQAGATVVKGNWDTQFGNFGAEGVVIYSMAASGNTVYVGGSFTSIGGVSATNIAKWDGSSWLPLNTGVDGPVYALSVSGGTVYAGGQFANAGATKAPNIAQWDGTKWSALGTGMDGPVYAISIQNTNVFAGGQFSNAGTTNATNVALWNGTAWSPVGDGVDGRVMAIATVGTNAVYVGGQFIKAGTNIVNNVAKWDGQGWSALRDGMQGVVNALAVLGTNVYAGGAFTNTTDVGIRSVALWDGQGWSALGITVGKSLPTINALAVKGTSLYVGGQFTTIADKVVNNVSRWDGTNWLVMGVGVGGTSPAVSALAASTTSVYVGGTFDTAGDLSARNLARWNVGNVWTAFGTGLAGYPTAVAVDVRGEVFVGGNFSQAGGVPVNNIAEWDGLRWLALSNGVGGPVAAVAVGGSSVYVGGNFVTAGNVSASYIARWDGTNWFALGSGLDGPVSAIAVSGSDVYVGGAFTMAGGLPAANVARWNGSSWSALGNGVDGTVFAIGASGSQVYVGGAFTNAGTAAALNIARWNGRWSALGGGIGSTVYAIAVADNGNVFVGGDSSDVGVINGANNIAEWNGTNWAVLGSGVNGVVRSILVNGAEVYVGGSFTTAGGISALNLARWHDDMQSWVSLGDVNNNGVNGNIFALAGGSSGLIAGGIFTPLSGPSAQNLARLSPSRWEALGNGVAGGTVSGTVLGLAAAGNAVYAGGSFTYAGGKIVSNIAKWDGTIWSALATGVNGAVEAIGLDASGEVFVGGDFTAAGGQDALHVAEWDGNKWSTLGIGLDGPVHALAVSGTAVYVGGEFTRAGGFSANNVARWDGSTWSRLGSGMNGKVSAIAADASGRIYAGGDFTLAGGSAANRIARWDGTNWSPLGQGVSASVAAIATTASDVFVGGSFGSAGGSVDIRNFARWDGSQWWALGGGVGGATNPVVDAIAVSPSGAVYIAGAFTAAGGLPANHVASWDGSGWSILGTGLDDTASAVAVRGRDVFVGGQFSAAGKRPSLRFGRWTFSNVPPSVSLTQPGVGATFVVPVDITIAADAADSDGTVTQVAFYAGANLLGVATNRPYSVTWTNVPAGAYSLTAKASDDNNATTTSSTVVIVVNTNAPPSVSILTPTNNATGFIGPDNVAISVSVFDPDDSVTRVDFYAGTDLIGSATNAPFSLLWSNVAAGSYTLTANATDSRGATTTSSPVALVVNTNVPPSVALTTPTNAATFVTPANLTLRASVSDSDDAVVRVDFYAGANLIGSATTNPFSLTWSNVAVGTYDLTAMATDAHGASTTSAPVNVTVQIPSLPPLTSPQHLANGLLLFQLTGQTGDTVVIQASTNLVDWAAIGTNTFSGSALIFIDGDAASYPSRFYRTVRNP